MTVLEVRDLWVKFSQDGSMALRNQSRPLPYYGGPEGLEME